jgi:uncharacterized UPF0160 family protein
MKTLATHDGLFHSDDVCATAILKAIFPESELVRTSDRSLLPKFDIVYDVGGEFDPSNHRYDHHFRLFNEISHEGIKYSSLGLITKYFSNNIISEYGVSHEALLKFDKLFTRHIDASDNRIRFYTPISGITPFDMTDVFKYLNCPWDQPQSDCYFFKAVDIASTIISGLFNILRAEDHAKAEIKVKIKSSSDNILILDKYAPWQSTVCKDSSILYVVFKTDDGKSGGWRSQAVPVNEGSFSLRKPFPESWRGLSGADLEKITGVEGCVFCHKNGYIVGTTSKESAIELSRIGVKS